eukprot:4783132-Pyramimonas_sp.AAC.1
MTKLTKISRETLSTVNQHHHGIGPEPTALASTPTKWLQNLQSLLPASPLHPISARRTIEREKQNKYI